MRLDAVEARLEVDRVQKPLLGYGLAARWRKAKARDCMAENLISRLTKVHKDEARAVLLSALYFFFVLSGYYILRPLREDMGLAGGVRNLHWLFRVTLL